MKLGVSIATVAVVLAFALILSKASLGGIAPIAILAAVLVVLLVARKFAIARARG